MNHNSNFNHLDALKDLFTLPLDVEPPCFLFGFNNDSDDMMIIKRHDGGRLSQGLDQCTQGLDQSTLPVSGALPGFGAVYPGSGAYV